LISSKLSFQALLFVSFGGALGTSSRYILSLITNNLTGISMIATLAVNYIGCFIMGWLIQFLFLNTNISDQNFNIEHVYLFFAVGFCGSFTTMSAFIYDMDNLIMNNGLSYSVIYIISTLVGSIFFYYLGSYIYKNIV
tara:strand:+ start:314 stop:727 length:414 start_codon:yes stop_codon:yes gene_type:complete